MNNKFPPLPASALDFFRATGRAGGSAKSPAKIKAARKNAAAARARLAEMRLEKADK